MSVYIGSEGSYAGSLPFATPNYRTFSDSLVANDTGSYLSGSAEHESQHASHLRPHIWGTHIVDHRGGNISLTRPRTAPATLLPVINNEIYHANGGIDRGNEYANHPELVNPTTYSGVDDNPFLARRFSRVSASLLTTGDSSFHQGAIISETQPDHISYGQLYGMRHYEERPASSYSFPTAEMRKTKLTFEFTPRKRRHTHYRTEDEEYEADAEVDENNEKRVNKLGRKKQRLAQAYGAEKVTSEGKLKGNLWRSPDGTLFWHSEHQNCWFHADYHSNWRNEMIAMDNMEHPLPYLIPPAVGEAVTDITSHCNFLDQHRWRFETAAHRSDILDTAGNHVFNVTTKPRTFWPSDEEMKRVMIHRGMIMLDVDDQPIIDHKGIPRCFSSKVEGGRMEAIKRGLPWIHASDIRARQPMKFIQHGKEKKAYGMSTLRHRQSRWRDHHCIPAYDERQGSKEKQAKWTQEGKKRLTDSDLKKL